MELLNPALSQIIIQAGGFGLAFYLVWWLTTRGAKTFDALCIAIEANTTVMRELIALVKTDIANRENICHYTPNAHTKTPHA